MSLSPCYSPHILSNDNVISEEHEQFRLREGDSANLNDGDPVISPYFFCEKMNNPYLVEDNGAIVKSLYFSQDMNTSNAVETAPQKREPEKFNKKEKKNMNIKKRKKSQLSLKNMIPKPFATSSSSYVIRNEPGKAHHVINISINDLSSNNLIGMSGSETDSTCVQYLVRDTCDYIMDETEYLISKIVKKISVANQL